MMNVKKIGAFLSITTLALTCGVFFFEKESKEVKGYTASSLPTTINLNDCDPDEIRDYYDALDNKSEAQRKGNNLLANLKEILKDGQKYYGYDGSLGDDIWKMYEITDRDWIKSPASEIPGFNPTTKIISNFEYNAEGVDPYIHALYVNRDVDNETTAYSDHSQSQWGINREHIWPKSQGFNGTGKGGARGDPMHLWAGNGRVNGTEHNNNLFGYVDLTQKYVDPVTKKGFSNLSGNYQGVSRTLGSGTVFEPQDSDKGDIARAIFYMAARYNFISGSDSDEISADNPNLELVESADCLPSYTSSETVTGKMGILSDLLDWNRIDPPDEWEIHRNNILYRNYTNNRNPFIDFPEWANIIWDSDSNPNPATPDTDRINTFNDEEEVPVTGVDLQETARIEVGDTTKLNPQISPNKATNKNVSWTSSNTNVATINEKGVVTGISAGKTLITVTTEDGHCTAVCSVSVREHVETRITYVDTLTKANTYDTASASGTGYKDWSNVSLNSKAIYQGNTSGTKTKNSINLREDKSTPSAIFTPTSGGYAANVKVNWQNDTVEGRILEIYGSSTPFTSAGDFYNEEFTGAIIGTIVKGSSTELDLGDDYEYLYIRAKGGTAYITSIEITWEEPIAVTGVSLNKSSIELEVGDSYELEAIVSPYNAENQNVYWESSSSNVVSVFDGFINANKAGTSTITVTTDEGAFIASCVVTVSNGGASEGLTQVFANNGYENEQEVPSVNFYQDSKNPNQVITGYFDKGVNKYNAPKYFNYGKAIRLYGGNTFTLVSSLANIVSIEFVFDKTSATLANYISVNSGTYTDDGPESATSGFWRYSGVMPSSVTFTVNGSKGQRRFVSVTVTYYDANSFSKEFLSMSGCDESGESRPTISWSEAENKSKLLFASDLDILKTISASQSGTNIAKCAARYDYIVGKYGEDDYNDFLNRNPIPIAHRQVDFNNDNFGTNIIIIISFASISMFAFLIVCKKKKSK